MSTVSTSRVSTTGVEGGWWKPGCQVRDDSVYLFDGIPPGHAAKGPLETEDYVDPAQAFISAIQDDLVDGYGFVPFIGAGFSVTAGIPMIRHLQQYLQRCICMVLGIDLDADLAVLEAFQRTSKTRRKQRAVTDESIYPRLVPRWNPRTDEWPPFIDRSRTPEDDRWERLTRLCIGDKKREGQAWLYRHALGAMQEWRTALEFLSHIELTGKSRTAPDDKDGPLRFCEPDRGIIDSCFREVMRNKRPSLNHRMLAALAAVLRIDLILTTNFDNLTEIAFDEYRNPLTAFDVHMGETLPDRSTVSRARSIIKLHGSQRSLRADFSLEGLPNAEDRQRFRDYLTDRSTESLSNVNSGDQYGDSQPPTRFAARHLIMLGVAAKEKRTIAFISNALRFIPDLHVYWICYSDNEVATVLQQFEGTKTTERHKSGELKARIRVIRHTNAGLLFLQLYQWIRKSLPTSGAIFPSTTRLVFPPLPWKGSPYKDNTSYKELFDTMTRLIPEKKDNGDGCRLLVAHSEPQVFGVASAAADVYRSRETSRNCIWLDLNDVHNADELFEAFREAAFQHLNESDWSPLFQIARTRHRTQGGTVTSMLVAEIVRIINSSNQPWTIFLNAREVPGANRTNYDHPNGWMDNTRGSERRAASAEDFVDIIRSFFDADAAVQANQVVLVVLCFSGKPRGRSAYGSHLLHRLALLGADYPSGKVEICKALKAGGSSIHPVGQVLRDVVEWTSDVQYEDPEEKRARRRFVQTLVSMQRPRHFAVAWSRCVNNEWHLVSHAYDKDRLVWLEDLQRRHLIRLSHGGFIWFTAVFREALRALLSLTPVQVNKGMDDEAVKALFERYDISPSLLRHLGVEEWNATAHQADIHVSLSTWYRKVLDATGTAACVFEIVDHLCWAAADFLEYESVRLIETDHGQSMEISVEESERALLATRHLNAARELLTEHIFHIQTQGYPGASLSRLRFLRNLWVGDELKRRTHTVCGLIRSKSTLTDKQIAILKEGKPLGGDRNIVWRELLRAIAKLQCTCDEVARAVYKEVSEDREAFRSHSHCGLRMIRDYPLTKDEVEGQLAAKRKPLYALIGDSFRRNGGLARQDDAGDGASAERRSRRDEWIRWWRWCAMLGNDSRSFDAAGKSSRRAIAASIRITGIFDMKTVPDLARASDAEDLKDLPSRIMWNFSGDAKGQLEALHSLEVAAFNLTLRAHTIRRARTLGIHLSASIAKQERVYDDTAFTYATKGLELVERMQNSGTPGVDHDFELHWCKSRMLMIAGISSLSKPQSDSRHAMTFLSDAAACLNSAIPERAHADLAIVELRCAEARLHEVSAESFVSGYSSLDELICGFLSKSLEENEAEIKLGAQKGSLDLTRSLRKVRSRTRDAFRFLDRAQRILRDRRRNVFWTTWYFERRMRTISFLLWAAVFEGASFRSTTYSRSIPYLGLEAATYGSDTDADHLLDDTFRMIRVDAYRMSMVALSYASCTRALHLLMRQRKDTNLEDRLGKMYERLEIAQKQIADALKARELYPRKAGDRVNDGALDNVAVQVIEQSVTLINRAARYTTNHRTSRV